MRNSLIIKDLILGELWKVCLYNNRIKEIVTVLLRTDLWLSSIYVVIYMYKNSNYKKTKEESTKVRNIFCIVSSPFPQKIINIHLYVSYKAFVRSMA